MLRGLIGLASCGLLVLLSSLAGAQAFPEPQPPLGASWRMSIQQVQELTQLDSSPSGDLRHSHVVRANNQTELVARWQDRAVSFLFARGFGLYAVGIEMVPWTVQHTITEADMVLRDLTYSAPVRLAVAGKYGRPHGISALWSAQEVVPLADSRLSTAPYSQASLIDWDYGRSWLIWRGQTTRLALGDQSVWYVGRDGLAYHERLEQPGNADSLVEQAKDEAEDAARRQQLKQARQQLPSQALGLEQLF